MPVVPPSREHAKTCSRWSSATSSSVSTRCLKADPIAVREIMFNLLSNAAKYSARLVVFIPAGEHGQMLALRFGWPDPQVTPAAALAAVDGPAVSFVREGLRARRHAGAPQPHGCRGGDSCCVQRPVDHRGRRAV